MYCRRCMYELRDLPEARCPECGASFDPQDAATFRKTRRRAWGPLSDWRAFLVWLGASCVPVILLGHFTAYVIAWITLGRMPRPWIDDPRDIGPAVDVACMVTWRLGSTILPAAFLTLFGLAAVVFARDRDKAPGLVPLIVVAMLGWLGGIAVLVMPGNEVERWYYD